MRKISLLRILFVLGVIIFLIIGGVAIAMAIIGQAVNLASLIFVFEVTVLITFLLFNLLYRFFPTSKKIILSFAGIISILFLLFILIEVMLRVTMTYASYGELNNKNPSFDFYQNRKVEKLKLWKPYEGKEKRVRKVEFTYTYPVNECGCIDSSFKNIKTGKKNRILCLGDSFTQGQGAPYDSSYPRLLEVELDKADVSAKVYNCGFPGAYPHSQFNLLKNLTENRILEVNSVIYGLHSSDFDDVKSILAPRPWFDDVFGTGISLYGMSYVVRYIAHKVMKYDANLIKISEAEFYQKETEKELLKIMLDLSEYCSRKGIKLSLIYLPSIWEVENNISDKVYQNLIHQLGEKNIVVYDLTNDVSEAIHTESVYTFYYKIDMHPKPEGYQLFAELIAKKNGLIDHY
jgi:lysophospholipase L1-like esterase